MFATISPNHAKDACTCTPPCPTVKLNIIIYYSLNIPDHKVVSFKMLCLHAII